MPDNVLICDDNRQVRDLIAVVLGSESYRLRHAADGQAALNALAEDPADLVILDLHVPGIDGLAILQTIRSDPALAGTRVLLVTGDSAALEADWGRQQGADAHLSKPFTLDALKDTVRALLTR